MKYLFLITGIALLSFRKSPKPCYNFQSSYIDTGHVAHIMDGYTGEWPDSLFKTDKTTSVLYAMDNDAENLFLALRIADAREQMKIMRQGMNLFVDVRGKKKESRGIEFPLKPSPGQGYPQRDEQRGDFDKKAFRESMGIRMIALKLFGFSDMEPSLQGLEMPGSANIHFTWDSTDVLHVEYIIPFSLLTEGGSLSQKTISVGWKILAIEAAQPNNRWGYFHYYCTGPAGRIPEHRPQQDPRCPYAIRHANGIGRTKFLDKIYDQFLMGDRLDSTGVNHHNKTLTILLCNNEGQF